MFDVIFRMLSDGDSAVPADRHGGDPRTDRRRRCPPGDRAARHPVRVDVGVVGRRGAGGRIDRRVDAVVVATEGPAAAALLGLPAVGSNAAGVRVVRRRRCPRPPTGSSCSTAPRSGPVLNVAVMSNVAPAYAPAGRHLVAAAMPGVGRRRRPRADRHATQLRGWWGPQVDGWRTCAPTASPTVSRQTPPFHCTRSAACALGDGLYVCGDHRDTASIQGALFSGRRCAEAVMATASVGAPPA